METIYPPLELHAPVGGLRRDLGFQQKSPYYFERGNNVRAFDVIGDRGRIGSRPGTRKAYAAKLGEPVPVNSVTLEFAATKDTHIGGDISPIDGNYGSEVQFMVGRASAVQLPDYAPERSLLHFNLNAIPAAVAIKVATLRLYQYSHVTTPLARIYRVSDGAGGAARAWTELGANWAKFDGVTNWGAAGGDFELVTPTPIDWQISAADGFVNISVLGHAQDAYTNRGKQLHMLLKLITDLTSNIEIGFFNSKDYTTITDRQPKLTINYETGGPAVGTDTEVRLLAVCRTLTGDPQTTFYEPFDDNPMSATHWDNPAWTIDGQASSGLPSIVSGIAEVLEGFTRAASLKDKNASVATLREVSIDISTMLNGSQISILMDMNDAAPALSGSVRCRVERTATTSWTLDLFINNGSSVAGAIVTSATQSTLRMTIDALGVVRCYLSNSSVSPNPNITHSLAPYTPAGSRVGFALKAPSGATFTDSAFFSHTYIPETGVQPSRMLCASANGLFYRETTVGTLAVLSTALTLTADRLMAAANRAEKLFIADYALRASGTAGFNTAGVFDEAAVVWNALGIDTDDDRLEITDPDYSVPANNISGVYGISAVAAGDITITPTPAANRTGLTWRIVRGPKVYDAALDTLTLLGLGTIGTSQFPVGCRSIRLWDDRLIACNDPRNRHLWRMSAKGFPLLWDHGDSGTVGENGLTSDAVKLTLGESAAIFDTTTGFAGQIGDPIIDTLPIRDDLCLFGCETGFYALRGNPRAGGRFNLIPGDPVGLLDIGAWCLAESRVFAMTANGLYEITLEKAFPLSAELIPQELKGLDPEHYEITIGHDIERRGILISAVARTLTAGPILDSLYYLYDLRTGGFFPQTHTRDHDATAVVTHRVYGEGEFTLLVGCRDGYVRRYDDDSETDDGIAFSSNVFYGPIRLGEGQRGAGYLREVIDTLDEDSGGVTVKAYVAHTAQAALDSTAKRSTTMSAGRNRIRPWNIRGGACYLETVGSPGSAWAREILEITRSKAGRLRIL